MGLQWIGMNIFKPPGPVPGTQEAFSSQPLPLLLVMTNTANTVLLMTVPAISATTEQW